MHVIERTQNLKAPLENVFRFFQRPENLERLTPPWLQFRILTPGPVRMRAGAIIDYSVRCHGLPIRWTAAIAEWDPPHGFVDLQLQGPYSFWHHQHEFTATTGGTRVVDRVHYELPYGVVGKVAHALLVKRDLERIFDFRHSRLGDLQTELESGQDTLSLSTAGMMG
jgi:ligand-binding SRPBCC domain-containing protein